MAAGHPIWVLGLGASGAAAAELWRAAGAAVEVWDAAAGPAQEARAAALRAQGIAVQLGTAALPDAPCALAVISPGIPADSAWPRALRVRGVPLVPEFECGWSRRPPGCRCVAVTGSNGKSTAVKWLGEALAAAGLRAAVAGNYGPPVCRVAREHAALDWLVLEVSSFQLETAVDFRPDIGVLLNVQPNHLDRHGTLDDYGRLKARLFRRAGAGDLSLTPVALAGRVRDWVETPAGRWESFGGETSADWRFDAGRVWRGAACAADLRGTYFDNPVLGVAAAAVCGAATAAGANRAALETSARAFRPLPHRLQTVAVRRGVRFVDDSKATTLAAMTAALRMCGAPVRLIAGGRPKEDGFAETKEILARHARKVYLIGEAASAMRKAWSPALPCEMCGTLERALAAAWREAEPGDVILLSPACASFDQFENFEQRGDRFAQWAGRLSDDGIHENGKDPRSCERGTRT